MLAKIIKTNNNIEARDKWMKSNTSYAVSPVDGNTEILKALVHSLASVLQFSWWQKGWVANISEIKACIEYLLCDWILNGKAVSPVDSHCQIQVVYSDDCVDMSTMHVWSQKYKMVNERVICVIKNKVDELRQ